jgi:hypothetical protein
MGWITQWVDEPAEQLGDAVLAQGTHPSGASDPNETRGVDSAARHRGMQLGACLQRFVHGEPSAIA